MKQQLSLKESIDIVDIRKGRLHTKDYIFALFALSGLGTVVQFLTTFSFVFIPVGILFFLFSLYFNLVLVVKRFRDIGLGWYFAIPLYFLTFIMYLSSFSLNHLEKNSYQYGVMGSSIYSGEMMNASVSFGILVVVNLIATTVLIFWPSQKYYNSYGEFKAYNDLTRSIPAWLFALINPLLFIIGILMEIQMEAQDISRF